MRTLAAAGVCLLFLLPGSPAGAQERQIIINDGPVEAGPGPLGRFGPGARPPRTGTARIRGRVVSADTGAGVRRAQVRLMGPDAGSRVALTDPDGRFAFEGLPAGRVTLSISKPGYVQVQYGQTRPFESGKPIELADGQRLEGADITLPRGSVIAGRVLDEFGEPVADAMVTGLRSVWSNGRRRFQPAGRATTNDLGQYRLYGLAPGDYYVSAAVRDPAAMEMSFASMNGAPPPSPGDPAAPPPAGYAPTYFPGTAITAEAQKITVAAGQEAQGTDFALAPTRLSRISGTVVNSKGEPVEGAMLSMIPRSDAGFMPMLVGGGSRTSRNGAFTLAGVPPGDYTLQVQAVQIMTSGAGDNMMVTARVGGPGAPDAETAAVPLTVGSEHVTGVVVVTSKGATASGQVTFEGGRRPQGPPLRVAAMPAAPDGPVMGPGGTNVKPDGTFELRGLSGRRLIRPQGLPPGWALKSVTANGEDVTDTGVEFKGAEAITGIDIVVTPKAAQVSGTVTGSGGRPVTDYTVVIFSDDPQRWLLPSSRYVAGARPDQEGRFRIASLPAGSYQAVAVEYLAQGEWGDPEVLERLKREASSFTLGEGESRTLELKMR